MNCQLLYTNLILSSHYQTAANKGLSAMLATEYILIDISLIRCSLPAGRQVYHQLFIFDQQQFRAEAPRTYRSQMLKSNIIYVRYGRVTRTTSTAESLGR